MMHEFIESLQGIEVIADDFFIVGYGDTMDGAIADHHRRFISFLECCAECHATLNVEKFALKKNRSSFHWACSS